VEHRHPPTSVPASSYHTRSMIQIARLTWLQANRSSGIRAILILTAASMLIALWPGIFEATSNSLFRFQRVWAAASLGAVAVSAYLPALRSNQLREFRALDVQALFPRHSTLWPLSVWIATILYSGAVLAIATLVALALGAASEPIDWVNVLGSSFAAISLTAALSLALSTLISRNSTLLALTGLWIIAAVGAQGALPAQRLISIILPPVRALSMTAIAQWGGGQGDLGWGSIVLVVSTTAAGLATAVGIARFRWN
jgi:hypothetical protein